MFDLESPEAREAADGREQEGSAPATRPPRTRLGVALLIVIVGVSAAAFGALKLVDASADRQEEEQQLVALSQLEARLADLRSTAELRLRETATLDDHAAASRSRIQEVDAEVAALEANTIEIADPARAIQVDAWALYEAMTRVVALENRIAASMEGVAKSGNQRRLDTVETTVAALRSTQLGLVDALEAVDLSAAQLAVSLAAAGAPFDISEDFDGVVGGWEAGFSTNGVADVVDGAYEITSVDNGYLMWGLSPYDVADGTITVTATPVAVPDGGLYSYGVLCRARETDHLDAYWFSLAGDGTYQVGLFVPPGDFVDLLPTGRQHYASMPSALEGVVNRGLEANRIDVVCDGTDLSFSVNGELLWEGSDDQFTRGRVALSATTYDKVPVTVRFDDLRLTGAGEPTGGAP